MGGVRRETYWALEMVDDGSSALPERLNKVLGMFQKRHRRVRSFCASGGSLECLVGIFVDNNCGVTLDNALLRRMAFVGIALALDVYGPLGGKEEQ